MVSCVRGFCFLRAVIRRNVTCDISLRRGIVQTSDKFLSKILYLKEHPIFSYHSLKQMKYLKLLVILCLVVSYPLTKTSAQNLEITIDSLISTEFRDANGPGGVFMVTKNGKPMYRKAFGKANLELNVAMSPEHVFQLGSITKQFTAIAILMLEEQGKLNVMSPISKYVADYPQGDKITIHHLLTHTSGIKDFTKMKSLRDIAQKEMTPKMMVDFFKNEPIDFAPGEKFDYNNSGYVLLGYIIEVVAGMSYEDFIKKHIFEKVGMKQSFYASDRQIMRLSKI